MAVGFESIVGGIFGWGWTVFLIFLVVGIIVLFFIGGLWIAQQRKFSIPLLEIISLGEGKIAVQISKAGWFKRKRALFGLLEVGGETICLCKDGKRRIHNVSSEDYHEINGKRGLIVKRKDDDPDILVPISRTEVKNYNLLFEIAPADYRDVAVEILDEKKREAYSWWDENKGVLISIGVFVLMFVAMIVFFKFMQAESEGWRETAEKIMSNLGSKASSTAP